MYIVYLSTTTDKKINQPILDAIKNNKHTAVDSSFTKEVKNKTAHIAQITKDIKKADGIVIEATDTNFDMGRLITLALLQHKPVLILQKKDSGQGLDLGESRLVSNKTYKTADDKKLMKLVKDFTEDIKKQRLSYRFNLMLSRDINSYLMDQAQAKNISKADYIRTLIIQDMD